jgi:hypothetical protein
MANLVQIYRHTYGKGYLNMSSELHGASHPSLYLDYGTNIVLLTNCHSLTLAPGEVLSCPAASTRYSHCPRLANVFRSFALPSLCIDSAISFP